MARRRSPLREPLDEPDDDAVVAASPRTRNARRWRLRTRLSLVLFVVGGLAILAPTIAGKLSPLRSALLDAALPAGAGRIVAADASFSWLGSQSLGGVVVVDSAGQPVFAAESITVSRSLIGLASNRRNIGKITLVRPVAYLEARGASSNLEQFAQRLAEAAAQQPGHDPSDTNGPTIAQVEVVDGVVMGRDAATGQTWRIDGLAATGQPLPDGQWDVTGAGVMTLVTAAVADGANAPIPATVAGLRPSEAPSIDVATKIAAGRFKYHLFPPRRP